MRWKYARKHLTPFANFIQTQLQQNQTKSDTDTVNTSSNTATTQSGSVNTVKTEQKPVECNLCHRKFKNIPALNGHMRLHGGYFKKDAEAKKCDKKESTGPPLQTASVGIRALIEEKIISKRGKDILKVRTRTSNFSFSLCLILVFAILVFPFSFQMESNSIYLLLVVCAIYVCYLELICRTCATNVITPFN